jgi:hypothetical protein
LGRLRGKQPKLKPNQAKHLVELHDSGHYTQAELAELFGVGRSTVYRTIERMRPKPVEPERLFAQIAGQRAINTQASTPLKPHPADLVRPSADTDLVNRRQTQATPHSTSGGQTWASAFRRTSASHWSPSIQKF